ncbi:MAG: hypothetical protein ACK5XN_32415, partial [Bacteroidota bacterium]
IAALLALAQGAPARDGPAYEVFGRVLAPIASAVLGSTNNRTGAMVAECRINSGTGPLAAAAGTRLRVAIQAPDRFRVDVVRDGSPTPLTACRNGKELWAVPAAPMTALAKAAGFDTTDTTPDTSSPPLLPIALDAQMLAFLPVVFDVKDLGMEKDPQRRVLQFGLLPQLREAMQAEEFSGRAWIGADDRPVRLVLTTPRCEVDRELEKLDFADQLAATAWQPSDGQEALRLPASALNELFEKMLGARAGAE